MPPVWCIGIIVSFEFYLHQKDDDEETSMIDFLVYLHPWQNCTIGRGGQVSCYKGFIAPDLFQCNGINSNGVKIYHETAGWISSHSPQYLDSCEEIKNTMYNKIYECFYLDNTCYYPLVYGNLDEVQGCKGMSIVSAMTPDSRNFIMDIIGKNRFIYNKTLIS